ncbi:TPA: sulfite exporter TauE/SafE family protein [Candidatus Bipolaricaulota bacterium]|nr:sulfite exporter TauE/SafE family protein [Candidatus Bipolaricaulota bacterium]
MILTLLGLGGAAVFIGLIASMIGVGGGIFMVPLLSLSGLVGTTQEAVGTSLAAVIFTSVSSSLAYRRQRVLKLDLGLIMMPGAVLGAWLGAYLTRFISPGGLSLAFGLLLLYPAGMMLHGRQPREVGLLFRRSRTTATGEYHPVEASLLGLGAGLTAGFFGIGGGIVMVPAMAIFLGLEILQAVATSLFIMGPSALIGSLQHLLQGNLHPELALPLILGIGLGAQLGPRLSTRMSKARLRQWFGLILLYSAVSMILSGIGLF